MSSTIQRSEVSEDNSCGTDCECAPAKPAILDRKGIIGLARANAARNKAYKKATKAQKRVMIAQDVLSALSRRKIVAQSGAYLGATYVGDKPDIDEGLQETDEKASLQALLEKVTPCEVCAKGALFLCTVAMRNKVTVGEYKEMDNTTGWGGEELAKLLGNTFTPRMLATIENEFEDDRMDYLGPEPIMHLSHRFENDDAKKLRVIMRNIIENNGTFKPKSPKLRIDSSGYDQFGDYHEKFDKSPDYYGY
jgi:hypothetical protein